MTQGKEHLHRSNVALGSRPTLVNWWEGWFRCHFVLLKKARAKPYSLKLEYKWSLLLLRGSACWFSSLWQRLFSRFSVWTPSSKQTKSNNTSKSQFVPWATCLSVVVLSYLNKADRLIDWLTYKPVRSLRSSSMNLLVIPRSRLKFYGDRAFSVCAPKLWNNLPEHIKCSSNLRNLTSSLKTHLFKRYFNL